MPPSPRAAGALLVIAGSACFGTVGVAVDGALAAGFALPVFLAARYGLGALVAALLAVREPAGRARPGRRHLAALAIGLVGLAQSACFFLALQRIDVALVLALHFTFPAIVLAAESARRRRAPGRREAAACATALAGVVLVVLASGTGGADPVGLLLGLGSGVAYAVIITTSARVLRALPASTVSACQLTGLSAGWVVVCAVSGTALAVPGLAGVAWLVGIALACTALPMLLVQAGTHRVGPVASSTLATVEPVVGAALAALVLGQMPAPVALLGAALIVAAAGLLAAPRPATPAPVQALARRSRAVARAGVRALPVRPHGGGLVVAPGARREVVARRLPAAARAEQRPRCI